MCVQRRAALPERDVKVIRQHHSSNGCNRFKFNFAQIPASTENPGTDRCTALWYENFSQRTVLKGKATKGLQYIRKHDLLERATLKKAVRFDVA